MQAFDEPETSRDGDEQWWLEPSGDDTDARAIAAGLRAERRLFQLRCRLPLPPELGRPTPTRAFRPGVDDDAWLTVNASAFADHPDQGRWTHDDLREHLAAAWFDPDGFRIHEVGGQIAGFCWTKVHPAVAADVRRGEIFVIGVDPAFQGRGLGRGLTAAGLDWLWQRDHLDIAMLYVEAGNEPARALYDSMGFHHHSTRTGYQRSRSAS